LGFELTGQPARAVLVLHAAAGVGIVLLVPWKSLIAQHGLRHRKGMRWASVVLAAGVAVSLVFGFLQSSGKTAFGYLTAMDFHVGAAICIIPFVLWHVIARPAKLRPADMTRRNFMKGAALLGASGLGVVLLPGARRAPTGSFRSESPIPTQWMFDGVPSVDLTAWTLPVSGNHVTYDQLSAFTDRVTSVIDCTGGWYSEQEWEGVWLSRLVASARGVSSLNVRSVTGYSRRFAIEDAGRLLVATRMNGSPLAAGNGYPARLVAPGWRGFAWVKWLASIDVEGLPWWWQPPFPLQ
jgi:DMSO/TMAO reductase YedYZ molybdopterin-dependent catalytic subunit